MKLNQVLKLKKQLLNKTYKNIMGNDADLFQDLNDLKNPNPLKEATRKRAGDKKK